MKALYLLPIFSINLFAHVSNTIHFHYLYTLVNVFVMFIFILLGMSVFITIRAIFRRFV